jgi:oxygen-independent coproporphyrinogen-3 oxidase
VDNLENIGFSKPGCQGAYNILSMHDTHTILAAGAAAVSKICFGEGVDRIFNYKYPSEYIKNFEDVLKRKGAVYATNHSKKIFSASD